MQIKQRKIDLNRDQEYILSRHCQINYSCESPWKRKMKYQDYQKEWFNQKNQIKAFCEALKESMKDTRTIAEIIDNEKEQRVGYIWVMFVADDESGFCYADVQDIYIEEEFRKMKIAERMLEYAEKLALANGAKAIRSRTGCENIESIKLHDKLGYYQHHYEYEKFLKQTN